MDCGGGGGVNVVVMSRGLLRLVWLAYYWLVEISNLFGKCWIKIKKLISWTSLSTPTFWCSSFCLRRRGHSTLCQARACKEKNNWKQKSIRWCHYRRTQEKWVVFKMIIISFLLKNRKLNVSTHKQKPIF